MKPLKSRLFICFILFLSLSLTGCAPLKKKFIRRKKETASTVEPILDPLDYDGPEVDPVKLYRQHYSVWTAWAKDMDQAFDRDDTSKRKNFTFSQYMIQLNKMKKYLGPEEQNSLQGIIDRAVNVQKDLQRPEPMRYDQKIRKNIREITADIRGSFSPNDELNYR